MPVFAGGEVSVMGTVEPALYQEVPIPGVVVPGLLTIVSWYWWVQMAVSLIAAFILREMELAGPV